jgi:predicted ester cyclase
MAVAEDRVAIWTRLFGVMRGPWMGLAPTGREFSFPLVVIVEFREDLLVGETWHYDSTTACEQLGLDRDDVVAAAHRLSSPLTRSDAI